MFGHVWHLNTIDGQYKHHVGVKKLFGHLKYLAITHTTAICVEWSGLLLLAYRSAILGVVQSITTSGSFWMSLDPVLTYLTALVMVLSH